MRARRLAALAALVLTALLLQVSVLPVVAGGGFVPDLLLVLVVVLTLEHGARTGLWVAASGGLLVDLATSPCRSAASMLVLVDGRLPARTAAPLPRRARGPHDRDPRWPRGGARGARSGRARALLSDEQVAPGASVVAWSVLVVGAFAVLLAPPCSSSSGASSSIRTS
jgi:hypothetical protein